MNNSNNNFGNTNTIPPNQNNNRQPLLPKGALQNPNAVFLQSPDNVNQQMQSTQSPTSIQNVYSMPINNIVNNNLNDEELLKAFIGKNYDKITTKTFNFAGFFFNSLYMFYRKMFLYGIILAIINILILNIIKNNIIIILLDVVIGLFVNKIYLYNANKKIAKIKFENQLKTTEELKNICSSKGGTSGKNIFLGIVSTFGIAFIISLIMTMVGIGSLFNNIFDSNNGNIIPNNIFSKEILVKNAEFGGYSCIYNQCKISVIDENDNPIECALTNDNQEFFQMLTNYYDFINIDRNHINFI